MKLRIFRVETGEVECEVKHLGTVWAVAFHPQGDLIATGSGDKKLRLIRVSTGAVEREVEHGDWVNAYVFLTPS